MTSPYRRPEPVGSYIIAGSLLNAAIVLGGIIGYIEYHKYLIRSAVGSVPAPVASPAKTLSEAEQFSELLNRKVRQR